MVRVMKLTDRVLDPSMSKNVTARQIKLHVLKVGHGIGRIDLTRVVLEMSDEEFDGIIDSCGEYGRFKLGNLHTYHEVDVSPEQAARLVPEMPSCRLKKEMEELQEGFISIRKLDCYSPE